MFVFLPTLLTFGYFLIAHAIFKPIVIRFAQILFTEPPIIVIAILVAVIVPGIFLVSAIVVSTLINHPFTVALTLPFVPTLVPHTIRTVVVPIVVRIVLLP